MVTHDITDTTVSSDIPESTSDMSSPNAYTSTSTSKSGLIPSTRLVDSVSTSSPILYSTSEVPADVTVTLRTDIPGVAVTDFTVFPVELSTTESSQTTAVRFESRDKSTTSMTGITVTTSGTTLGSRVESSSLPSSYSSQALPSGSSQSVTESSARFSTPVRAQTDVTVPPGRARLGNRTTCISEFDCRDDEACIGFRCGDPCNMWVGSCGPRALCITRWHTSQCLCLPRQHPAASPECSIHPGKQLWSYAQSQQLRTILLLEHGMAVCRLAKDLRMHVKCSFYKNFMCSHVVILCSSVFFSFVSL